MPDVAGTADVIVVGGGSAGAVLAARLSQDPARTVLLLEAGHAYVPDAYPPALLDANKIADPDHDWGYTSRGTSQSARVPAPRGKVLGGSSAVNAAVALRARAADFAKWGAHGAEGWSFDDVLPVFRLLENTPAGDGAYHGRTGPLPIRQRTDGELTPSLRGFTDAAVAHGFKRVHDFNGAEQNGAGGYPVDVVDGVWQNTGLVYLTAEVRRRPSLTIRGDVTVDRVLFDGTTAAGVRAADGTVYRGREVILSGGTYGSPAILLRSGIGPAGELTTLGIEVIADLPVGQRLQDQVAYANAYALAPGYLEMPPAVGSLLWTASTEAAGDELDLHVTATHLMPGSLSPTGGAIVLLAALVQPEATGTLKLASRDPRDAPLIDPSYLGTGRGTRRLLEAVKLGRAIARNPVFAPFTAAELALGDAVADDDALARAGEDVERPGDELQVGAAPVALGPVPADQARLLEYPQVVGEQVRRHRQHPGELRGGRVPLAEGAGDPQPGRVGERRVHRGTPPRSPLTSVFIDSILTEVTRCVKMGSGLNLVKALAPVIAGR